MLYQTKNQGLKRLKRQITCWDEGQTRTSIILLDETEETVIYGEQGHSFFVKDQILSASASFSLVFLILFDFSSRLCNLRLKRKSNEQ